MTLAHDIFPVEVRGPLATTRSGLVTFARLFVYDGKLYIAESRNRGSRVASVTAYPLPEGEPVPDRRRSKGYTWGPWSYWSCGCSSGWRKHSVESLVALAQVDEPGEPEPETEPDVTEDPETETTEDEA